MENHLVTIDNRQRMTITQVADVDAFDEQTLWANLKEGSLEIEGQNLNVEKLDLQQGILIITGEIHSLCYADRKIREKKRFFRKQQK